MKKLDEFLHKKVRLKIYDGKVLEGILHKTEEDCFKEDWNLCLKRKHYVLTDEDLNYLPYVFKKSHVVKIEEI